MGCDIHCYAERQINGKWYHIDDIYPFRYRNYGIFGFLANVRNYSKIPAICDARGIPENLSDYVKKEFESFKQDYHDPSHIMIEELLEFDYNQQFEDRRCMKNNDFGSSCGVGEGKLITFKEFFGGCYFKDLEMLKKHNAERIVFWFDN